MMPEVIDIAAMNEALSARPWHSTIPLLVLTRGHAGARNGPAFSRDALTRYEIWLELQRELATRSPRAEHIIAKESGHDIQNDEPQLIIHGVRRIVANLSDKFREGTSRPLPSARTPDIPR